MGGLRVLPQHRYYVKRSLFCADARILRRIQHTSLSRSRNSLRRSETESERSDLRMPIGLKSARELDRIDLNETDQEFFPSYYVFTSLSAAHNTATVCTLLLRNVIKASAKDGGRIKLLHTA